MKIRLSIFSHDISYTNHLVNFFNIHYFDKVEISRFTDIDALSDFLARNGADILLVDEETDTTALQVRGSVSIACLCEEKNNAASRDKVRIFKYQKAELIYKRILGLYASGDNRDPEDPEKAGRGASLQLFFPIHGGTGASTVSGAYALRHTAGRKVLYLNLEVFGDCSSVFEGEGEFGLDDILYALKSRRGSLRLKIESSLRRTREGLFFYAPVQNPLSLLEMSREEWKRLLEELKGCGLFDEIVLDMDGYPSEWLSESMKEADGIWVVADGTETSRSKLMQFQKYMEAMEKKGKDHILFKARIFYNKCKNGQVTPLAGCQLRIAGNCLEYTEEDKKTVMKKMAASGVFSD